MIINDVPTPPFPQRTPSKSGPTPPDKRVLDQKEFDKKLKAKRAFFSKVSWLDKTRSRLMWAEHWPLIVYFQGSEYVPRLFPAFVAAEEKFGSKPKEVSFYQSMYLFHFPWLLPFPANWRPIFLSRLKYWDKESAEAIRETEGQAAPRGELDFLNMEQLINIRDLESSHGPKGKLWQNKSA